MTVVGSGQRAQSGIRKIKLSLESSAHHWTTRSKIDAMIHGMPSSEDTCPSTVAVATPTASIAVPADDERPRKRILSQAHLKAFKESETHKDIVDFVEELNAANVGKKLSDAREESPVRDIFSSLPRAHQLSKEGCTGCSSHLGHPRRSREDRTGDTASRQCCFQVWKSRIQDVLRQG